jgi:hypothetical protein
MAGQWAVHARSFTTAVVQDDAGVEDLFKPSHYLPSFSCFRPEARKVEVRLTHRVLAISGLV